MQKICIVFDRLRTEEKLLQKKAEELGGKRLIDIIIEDSHSCYKGYRNNRYEWGYGCNSCPACDLRAKGWLNYTA